MFASAPVPATVPNPIEGSANHKVQVIILSVFLVIAVLALIGFIIFHFVTRKPEPKPITCPPVKATATVSPTRPISIQETRVGPVYRSASADVNALIEQVNKIVYLSQQQACVIYKQNMEAQMNQVFSATSEAKETCVEVAAQVKAALAATDMHVPANITIEIDTLFQMLIKDACDANGMVDKAKLQALMTDFIRAFCA